MDSRSVALLTSAVKLYRLSIDLDKAREKLRRLNEQGISDDPNKILASYLECVKLDLQCKNLEKEYLALRNGIISDEQKDGQADCKQ